MALKSRRIEMRTDSDSESRIARAAAARRVSVSAFVLEAAVREADRVLALSDHTRMPAEQFDALLSSLDSPDPAPRLAAAAAAPRSFSRE